MKFKNSITTQVFFIIFPIFLLALVLQMIFFGKYLTPFYTSSLIKKMHFELKSVSENFSSKTGRNTSSTLRDYTIKNEAPVLVVTEDYQLLDENFFSYLGLLTVKSPNLDTYKLPIATLYELSDISFTEKLNIKASRLGNSTYYEPYVIRSDKKTYYYQSYSNEVKNKQQVESFASTRNWYAKSNNSLTNERANIIYKLMKQSLINKTSIEKTLKEITEQVIRDKRGVTYCVISEKQKINGVMTYFITIRPVVLSENETIYFTRYFYIVFSILAALIAVTIYILSKKLSNPIINLSIVTKKLASQDFSVRAESSMTNEVGELAYSINLMAANLQSAILELQQSANVAHKNEESMKRLLADLAHEFKTPLGIISLYTEVIENGLYEKEPSYYHRIIEHEIENLTHIIDETIQLTKLQAGYWKYSPEPTYINDLIDVSISKFSEELTREKFKLEMQILDVTVMADGRRIEQVLTNLISNALKYSGEKKQIEVLVTQEGDIVTVSISNYGDISEEDLEHIWERYYRAAEDTSLRLPSQGIGLEIVRYILTMHKSNFGVQHESGKISFYFTLQIVDE